KGQVELSQHVATAPLQSRPVRPFPLMSIAVPTCAFALRTGGKPWLQHWRTCLVERAAGPALSLKCCLINADPDGYHGQGQEQNKKWRRVRDSLLDANFRLGRRCRVGPLELEIEAVLAGWRRGEKYSAILSRLSQQREPDASRRVLRRQVPFDEHPGDAGRH